MSTEPQLIGKPLRDLKPLRVLLVEDSENDAFMVERHLRRSGFNPFVLRVDTAEEMRHALLHGSDLSETAAGWDVILADYHLPTFSAPEALKLAKESGADLPFIVLSGAVSEETAVAAMRAGAHDYVSKQNLARLVPAIEREIGEAKTRLDRTAAEKALLSSEQRFRHLADAAPLGLLISDASGRLLYANRAAERLLDDPAGAIQSGSAALKGLLNEAAKSLSLPGAAGPESKSAPGAPFEMHYVTAQGEPIPILVAATILNPEAPLPEQQMAAFLVDLTEQRRGQEAVRRTEKLAATGRLAASIAHEINNPLEAVTNCLYLMQQMEHHPAARRYLDMAQRELDRVIHITTQTLRFYRQNTRPVETDIHELLETVLVLYEGRMRALGVEPVREFSAIPRVMAYDGEVRQILSNLIGNAIDAMQAGGGKLTLRTALGQDWQTSRKGITITIADSGAGMDRRTMKRIFEPFFSTKGATGTGLGLWVSSEILSKHQGSIHVRSHPRTIDGPNGGWTAFRVFLPAIAAPRETWAPQDEAAVQGHAPSRTGEKSAANATPIQERTAV